MRIALCLALTALTAAACSSSAPSNPSSTVEGKVAASTFALGAPTSVEAIDESGARTRAAVGADGAFKLSVTKAHVYRLVAVTPKGEEPIVFPRADGRLDKTFRVSSGAAIVALGNVRHFDKAPATGFTVKTAPPAPAPATTTTTQTAGGETADGAPGECVNGSIMGTGAPCVDDEGKTSCESGNTGADDQSDGECNNGKDATGAACTDPQEGEAADPAQSMAVPDKNPPNDVAGCDDGGQSEGEGGGD
jgi:hypothetical protein